MFGRKNSRKGDAGQRLNGKGESLVKTEKARSGIRMENKMKLTEIVTIKALCAQFGFGFKKKFGQNFLTTADVPIDIARNAEGICALEIGPGFGTLTAELCQVAKKVVARP